MAAPRTRTRPAAIVIGLDSLQGLQTARILRRHDIPVIAVVSDEHHPACRTRVCDEIHVAADEDQLLEALHSIGRGRSDRPVLVPCQDKSVRTVARHHDDLSAHFRIVLPPPDTVELLADKVAFLDHARRHALPVPATHVLHSRDDAARAAAELSYPCLLKPAYRTDEWDRHTKRKVFEVGTPEELLERYERTSGWAEAMIAQQRVEGDDSSLYSCNCYLGADGEPLVTFVARKLRQWPPGAGTSCLGVEVRDDVVLETTLQLFRTVPYRGLGYVEIKRDARTGEYFIIEPNVGRPTGRAAIAEAGGVELLLTMYCDAVGLPLPAERTQTYGEAKWIDLRHDLQSAFVMWRRGELGLGEWIISIRGRKAHAVFSWSDPLPFLFDAGRAVRLAARTGGRSRFPSRRTRSARAG